MLVLVAGTAWAGTVSPPATWAQKVAQTPPVPPSQGERRGEAFTFNLRFTFLDAGRVRLAIPPPVRVGERRLIHVTGQAEATGVARLFTHMRDDYSLVLDADTLLPTSIQVEESGYRTRLVRTALSGKHIDIRVIKPQGEQRFVGDLPGEPHDPVTALMILRQARLRDGDRMELWLLDGSALYRGDIQVAGHESLDTVEGRRPAVRLLCSGVAIRPTGKVIGDPPRKAVMWLSDDAARLPLRIDGDTDLGTAHFELTSHQPPHDPQPGPTRLPGFSLP